MGFAVVHMMKIKSGAVGGIQSHNNREHEPKTNPDEICSVPMKTMTSFPATITGER